MADLLRNVNFSKEIVMRIPNRTIVIWSLLMVLSVCLFSCEKQRQGKVIVSEYDFYIERVAKTGFKLCAKGKVKNVGVVDVKNVVVSGNCLTCNGVYRYDGSWLNPPDTAKSVEQQPAIKDIPIGKEEAFINYLPTGKEEAFIIKNIAYAPVKLNQLPKRIPKKLEVVVVSFETASK